MKAKEFIVDEWLNTSKNFSFDVFDSKIKVIHVFQMLCPGCVYRGIPQTDLLYKKLNSEKVSVLALHSVFENHEAMLPHALKVFISEWKLPFPVGIDHRKEGEWMPETMKAYQLQGTPSLIVIDHLGEVRVRHFGHFEQEKVEKLIGDLVSEMEKTTKEK